MPEIFINGVEMKHKVRVQFEWVTADTEDSQLKYYIKNYEDGKLKITKVVNDDNECNPIWR